MYIMLVKKLIVDNGLGKPTTDVDLNTDVNIKTNQSSECQLQPMTMQLQNLDPSSPVLPTTPQNHGAEAKIATFPISSYHHHSAHSTSPEPLPPKCKN